MRSLQSGRDGEVTGVIGAGQDITDLRALTTEQQRVAEDLSRLIETARRRGLSFFLEQCEGDGSGT